MLFKLIAGAYFMYSLIYSASFIAVEIKKGRRVAAGAMSVIAVFALLLLISAAVRL